MDGRDISPSQVVESVDVAIRSLHGIRGHVPFEISAALANVLGPLKVVQLAVEQWRQSELEQNAVQEIVSRLDIPLDCWWCNDAEKIEFAIEAPDFSNKGRVHDWRNYVPEWAVSHWGDLLKETQLAIYLMSEKQAHNEEWD